MNGRRLVVKPANNIRINAEKSDCGQQERHKTVVLSEGASLARAFVVRVREHFEIKIERGHF